jgi:5-methyltetrahydrofolate--homocysteine methyltransferase
VNPLDADLIYSIYSSALLSGRDKNGKHYVDFFTPEKEKFSFSDPLSQAILEGRGQSAETEAKKKLSQKPSLEIISQFVVPALNKVGELYSKRTIFLPQLIESAKASQKAMTVIRRGLTQEEQAGFRGKILIATVKGDIHDIGKNLVSLMLENHSFQVRDMGVDVGSEKIVREARKWRADIIALSSLMTTTMGRMDEIMDILKKEKLSIPVMIGGAAVTEKFAGSIGAYYGRDAVEAVKVADKLSGK